MNKTLNKTYYIVMMRRISDGEELVDLVFDGQDEAVAHTRWHNERTGRDFNRFIVEAQETRRFDVEVSFTEKEIK